MSYLNEDEVRVAIQQQSDDEDDSCEECGNPANAYAIPGYNGYVSACCKEHAVRAFTDRLAEGAITKDE